MAKSPVTQPSTKVEKQLRKSEPGGGNFLLVSIFRLLLLGVSSSLAVLVGMAIAQFYPSKAQEPPLIEKALRQSQNWINHQKQALFPKPQASPIAPSPINSPINQLPPSSASPLSNVERDKLQAELTRIQAQIKSLDDRAATPETPLNSQPITAAPSDAPTMAETQGNALMVTLPSDALFDATQTSLRPESLAILDSLITDLQRYSGATVRVAAHSDEQGAAEADRSRSFEQAKAVKQYLNSKLGKNYQWVAIGYGHGHPLAGNSSPSDRQRNRRIEITLDPQ